MNINELIPILPDTMFGVPFGRACALVVLLGLCVCSVALMATGAWQLINAMQETDGNMRRTLWFGLSAVLLILGAMQLIVVVLGKPTTATPMSVGDEAVFKAWLVISMFVTFILANLTMRRAVKRPKEARHAEICHTT